MTTKLILTHDVSHLGSAGEVVEVKDGYARNYLLPRKLATPWTKGAQRQIDQMTEARRKRAVQMLEFFDRIGLCRRVGDTHVLRLESEVFKGSPE